MLSIHYLIELSFYVKFFVSKSLRGNTSILCATIVLNEISCALEKADRHDSVLLLLNRQTTEPGIGQTHGNLQRRRPSHCPYGNNSHFTTHCQEASVLAVTSWEAVSDIFSDRRN